MPQDGTIISCIVHEISQHVLGGRIDKITQPEPDEIHIAIRAGGNNHKLLLTNQSSSPRLHFTKLNKQSPAQAPQFCMVLRKHISGGRIVDIRQPNFERIAEIDIEALNEMGDKSIKTLVIELMGKHSNIMLLSPGTDPESPAKIIDAIKHVPPSVSAVRAILPGGQYTPPPSGNKKDPLYVKEPSFSQTLLQSNLPIQKALYQCHTGISPILASEICTRARIHPDAYASELTQEEWKTLYNVVVYMFVILRGWVLAGTFACRIYYDQQGKAMDITAMPFNMYSHLEYELYKSPSALLEAFYAKRDAGYRINQKTADLRKLITTHQERCNKKTIVYEKTLEDIKNRDSLRIKGEILTAYLHQVERGAESVTLDNFYDNTSIEIPLSPNLSPTENAQRYFKQYNKQKRTHTALQEQIQQNQEDQFYLDSVAQAMETVTTEADIAEIRAELAEQGFVKRKYARPGNKNPQSKKGPGTSKPLRFTSSDGYEIYVGKNNTQNDYLTLRQAKNHDIWMHTKDIAGSHVIIVTGGANPPESTILEGANIAAYYSKGRSSSQVPVDYVQRKHVRKPSGAKPGFVIYDRHKTVYVTPEEPR